MKSLPVFVVFLSFLILLACTKDKAKPISAPSPSLCDSVPHAFASNVFPVMQQQCIGCHSATNPQGGYVLDNYTSISEHIELILKTINHEAGVVPMPYQTDKLNDTLIQIISCWNSDGTPNN